jgi:hypothetical protein
MAKPLPAHVSLRNTALSASHEGLQKPSTNHHLRRKADMARNLLLAAYAWPLARGDGGLRRVQLA